MPYVAVLQKRIEQHGAERRAERERQARLHPAVQPAIHDLDERQVGFGDGLEEPVLLQKMLVLRMPDKRQMGVEDEGEVTLHWSLRPHSGPGASSVSDLA